MNKRYSLAAILLLVLTLSEFAISPDSSVHACTPPEPLPWFRQSFVVGENRLPPEVEIRITPQRKYGDEGPKITFVNHSETPLYLLARPNRPTTTAPLPVEVPDGFAPTQRFVNGKWTVWMQDPAHPDGAWVARPGKQLVSFLIVEKRLTTLWGDVVDDVILHHQSRGERPANVPVPAPQSATVNLVYGETLVALPLTIQYELNPGYSPPPKVDPCLSMQDPVQAAVMSLLNPPRQPKPASDDRAAQAALLELAPLGVGLIVLGGALVVGTAGFLWWRRGRK